jgi:hypothetical protein
MPSKIFRLIENLKKLSGGDIERATRIFRLAKEA